jgi:hypothetical protein
MRRAEASRRCCAIYTRKSSEEGLEQEFNSLAAQREACEAYIHSQQHEGWALTRNQYDDGLDRYLIRRAVECATITYDQLTADAMPAGAIRVRRLPAIVGQPALAG